MKNKIFIVYLALLSSVVLAQQKQIVTSIDKTKNKIGGEFKLTLKTSVDTTAKVAFPNPKSFGALEVIESYKVDTVKNGGQYELIKKYGLTQFDSGRYVIPRVTVLINNKPFFSDSLRVEVANIPVDTLKQKMYDIKPIAEVTSSKSWIWKLLLTLLLLARKMKQAATHLAPKNVVHSVTGRVRDAFSEGRLAMRAREAELRARFDGRATTLVDDLDEGDEVLVDGRPVAPGQVIVLKQIRDRDDDRRRRA